jgi:putative SOS response-associated peptidase YedK
MCGRFTLTATPDEIEALFAVLDIQNFPPRYNIAPTQPILMVVPGPPQAPGSNLPANRAVLVRWGFIPAWAKDPKSLPLMFNARSETVAEKATFRTAMRHRRTLVPATGFYEWRKDGKKRIPYFLKPRDGAVVAFAGLMETYADPNGSELDTGTILTTAASTDIAAIHERMPVVVRREDFARWLDCRTQEPRDVADLLRPAEPGTFEIIPVSDKVNKVDNSGPEIQQRIEQTAVTVGEPVEPKEPPPQAQLNLF